MRQEEIYDSQIQNCLGKISISPQSHNVKNRNATPAPAPSEVPVAPQPQAYASTLAPGKLKVPAYVDQQPLSQVYYNCMPYPALMGAEQQMVPQQAIPPQQQANPPQHQAIPSLGTTTLKRKCL